ncbi:MAG: preprotein translocase subunit SecE [Candidatus Omnitrophota bacterium]
MIKKIRKFVTEVILELKKVSWSTKKELIDSTWIVFLSTFFLGIFIAATDFVLSKLLELIIR